MNTEEPDGPMPLCMSPESYRAEITRRKSAERERDDLAKQAERLIETSEQLRANVATLVEQLGEAERRATVNPRLYEGLDLACSSLEKFKPIATYHDRLALIHRLRSVLADAARGAVQPAVEPRDEAGWCSLDALRDGAVFETRDGIRAVKSEYRYDNFNQQPLCVLLASGEYAHFQNGPSEPVRELAGYAPPSQPTPDAALREALVAVRDEEYRLDRSCDACDKFPAGSNADCPACALALRIDAALAGTPPGKAPDGTAPEPDDEAQHPQAKTGPYHLFTIDHQIVCGAESGVGYHEREKVTCAACLRDSATRPPDGMPGEPAEGEEPVTLADLLADLECMLREADAAFANGSDYDYESEIRKTIHRFSPDSTEPAAPPTVPGEPPQRENRHVDHWAHIECVLNGPAIEFSGRAIEQARGARCRHGYRWRDEIAATPPTVPGEPDESTDEWRCATCGFPGPSCPKSLGQCRPPDATPPTVPGEPPRGEHPTCLVCGGEFESWEQAGQPSSGCEFVTEPCYGSEHDRSMAAGEVIAAYVHDACMNKMANRLWLHRKSGEAWKEPSIVPWSPDYCADEPAPLVFDPLPPTPPRAPVDEAAVRAALRQRLIELRAPYGDERAVAFNAITAVGTLLFGEPMPPSLTPAPTPEEPK